MREKKRYKVKPRFYIILSVLIAFIIGMTVGVRNLSSNNVGSSNDNIAELSYRDQIFRGEKIMVAAKKYINNKNLVYDPSYFTGGYPPNDNIGVCTDVIWKGFEGINVTLKDLVDKDISENFDAYSDVISVADPNINFRYVPVLEIFFQRNAQTLSNDVNNLIVWRPGDIVTFESSHIAIVSCLHNLWGQPYIIQHGHDPAADEDRIFASDGMTISGHFRWI